MTTQRRPDPDRRAVLALALAADVDIRTARRALVEGVDSIRGVRVRERLEQAASSLHLADREHGGSAQR